MSGVLPFNADDEVKLFGLIKEGKVGFPSCDWAGVSAPAKDLILMILNTDPDKRYGAKKILSHPWMKEATDKALLDTTVKIKEYNKKPKMIVKL